MSLHPEDERAASDEAFVRRLAEAYAPPPRTASQRVAFQAALDERLRREGRRGRLGLGLAALAAAAAAVLVLRVFPEPTGGGPAVRSAPVASDPTPLRALARPQEEAILALSVGTETASEEALPADYEAIAGVFLGS